ATYKTNADVLDHILGDMTTASGSHLSRIVEPINFHWDRETAVLAFHPDAVVIHKSGIFHAMNEKHPDPLVIPKPTAIPAISGNWFEYPDPPTATPNKQWQNLYDIADDTLI